MKWLESCLIAISMYSKIPVPQVEWTKEKMSHAMCFFPLIGVVIGVLLQGLGILCTWLSFGDTMRGASFVLLPVLVTGGIHMDGFLDTTDALRHLRRPVLPPEPGAEAGDSEGFPCRSICYYYGMLLFCTGIGSVE